MRTLVTGGIKSGKSSLALSLASEFDRPRLFVATAVAFDDHMREKIARHRDERDESFRTVEEPIEIGRAVGDNMVLDCITMWVNNLFFHERQEAWGRIVAEVMDGMGTNAVVVTNEVGLGNVPMDPITRSYNEILAHTNRRFAEMVDRVVLMVCGRPLVVSGPAL